MAWLLHGFKYMFLKKAFIIFSLTMSVSFQAISVENQCLQRLSKIKKGPRNLETLIEKMEGLGIRLELSEEIDTFGSAANDYFEIHAYDSLNEKIGEISMVPIGQAIFLRAQEKPLYTSHIEIYATASASFRGVGLGTYLYVSAARAIHRIGGVLFSSTGPSSQAIDAWERMVATGWAIRGTERDAELSQINSPITSLSSYRFDQDLLDGGFFDDLDYLIEDLEMVFVRY